MRQYWRTHFLGCELVASLLFAVALIVVDRCTAGAIVTFVAPDNRGTLYGALASIFGGLLGFVITAVSILLTFAPSESFTLLRSNPHYVTLWNTYKSAIRALALATTATLAGLVLDRERVPQVIAFYAVVWSSVYASARVARCVWILEKVIDVVAQPTASATEHSKPG